MVVCVCVCVPEIFTIRKIPYTVHVCDVVCVCACARVCVPEILTIGKFLTQCTHMVVCVCVRVYVPEILTIGKIPYTVHQCVCACACSRNPYNRKNSLHSALTW